MFSIFVFSSQGYINVQIQDSSIVIGKLRCFTNSGIGYYYWLSLMKYKVINNVKMFSLVASIV